MSIFNILVGILFMLFSVSAEASTFEKDVINLSMSSQVYEIKVCKDVETTFFLPDNQRLLKIEGDSFSLDVDGAYRKSIETDKWYVQVIKRRGHSSRFRKYHYVIRIKPLKNNEASDFTFVTNKWSHKFILENSANPVLVCRIDNTSAFEGFECLYVLWNNIYFLLSALAIILLLLVYSIYKSRK